MQTTRFRVWLKAGDRPVWPGVKAVHPPECIVDDALDVTVEGDGSDLKRLINSQPRRSYDPLEARPGETIQSVPVL